MFTLDLVGCYICLWIFFSVRVNSKHRGFRPERSMSVVNRPILVFHPSDNEEGTRSKEDSHWKYQRTRTQQYFQSSSVKTDAWRKCHSSRGNVAVTYQHDLFGKSRRLVLMATLRWKFWKEKTLWSILIFGCGTDIPNEQKHQRKWSCWTQANKEMGLTSVPQEIFKLKVLLLSLMTLVRCTSPKQSCTLSSSISLMSEAFWVASFLWMFLHYRFCFYYFCLENTAVSWTLFMEIHSSNNRLSCRYWNWQLQASLLILDW